MAYTSDESGAFEVYVRPFPVTGGKWQVSTHGGSEPKWRPDGREIYYIAPDKSLMAVAISTSPGFELGEHGQRFLVNTIVEGGNVLAYHRRFELDGGAKAVANRKCG